MAYTWRVNAIWGAWLRLALLGFRYAQNFLAIVPRA